MGSYAGHLNQQLRQANDRIAKLTDEVAKYRKAMHSHLCVLQEFQGW